MKWIICHQLNKWEYKDPMILELFLENKKNSKERKDNYNSKNEMAYPKENWTLLEIVKLYVSLQLML